MTSSYWRPLTVICGHHAAPVVEVVGDPVEELVEAVLDLAGVLLQRGLHRAVHQQPGEVGAAGGLVAAAAGAALPRGDVDEVAGDADPHP